MKRLDFCVKILDFQIEKPMIDFFSCTFFIWIRLCPFWINFCSTLLLPFQEKLSFSLFSLLNFLYGRLFLVSSIFLVSFIIYSIFAQSKSDSKVFWTWNPNGQYFFELFVTWATKYSIFHIEMFSLFPTENKSTFHWRNRKIV